MTTVTNRVTNLYGRDICLLDDVYPEASEVSLYYDIEDREFYGPYGDPVGSPEEVLPLWVWTLFRSGKTKLGFSWHGRQIWLFYPTDSYWPGHYDE